MSGEGNRHFSCRKIVDRTIIPGRRASGSKIRIVYDVSEKSFNFARWGMGHW